MKLREILQSLGKYTTIVFGTVQVHEHFRNLKRDYLDAPQESATAAQNAEIKKTLREQQDTIITDSTIKGKVEAETVNIRTSMDKASSIDKNVGDLLAKAEDPSISNEERLNLIKEAKQLQSKGMDILNNTDNFAQNILD
jgi:hypothetical protein